MATYETKKQQCAERMIPFEFTKEEWEIFNTIKSEVTCAYTNITFSSDKNDHCYPTLERLDEDKGYSPDNCVWVSKHANRLKANYIENGSDTSKLKPHDVGFLRRIQRILDNIENINKIKQPYKEALQGHVQASLTHHSDVFVAQEYIASHSSVNARNASFDVSLSEYKTKLSRKKCQLTGRVITTPKIFCLVQSDKVTKHNLFVLEHDVYQGFIKMVSLSHLSAKEILAMLGE